jgi:hypothetical protein
MGTPNEHRHEGTFAEGQAHGTPHPEDGPRGDFARGQERDTDAHEGSFADGQARDEHHPEREHRGDFAA